MDVAWFLNRRLDFIQQLYSSSTAPFVERQHKIENDEEPFVQAYAEDGEPAFLAEWQETRDSIDTLGHACLCLLSSALQAYLHTRHKLHGLELTVDERRIVFRKGWVRGYNQIFTKAHGISFNDGPVSIAMLEDIVLTRNSIQHDIEITATKPKHAERKPGAARSFFLDDREVELLDHMDRNVKTWLAPPTVHVDKAKLEASIDAVRRFVSWFDEAIENKTYGRN